MQHPPPSAIGRAFTAELKRIALLEDKTMDVLCDEVATLVGLKGKEHRQLYNWRSGRWPLPSNVIPTLCRRFGSLALVNALVAECTDVQVEIPEGADLINLTSRTIRAGLSHYTGFLQSYESDGIQPHELADLRESGDRVVADVHMFYEIARADCERHNAARRERGVLIRSNQ